jgi:hypothetical protein
VTAPVELPPKAPDLRRLLQALVRHGVDFVVVGGMAGLARGATVPSFDLDIVYSRDRANIARLVPALQELEVRLRGAPADLPFVLEAQTIENGADFTFVTPYGDLYILADVAGIRGFKTLAADADEQQIAGFPVKVASLDHLIAMKRAANRPKDRNMLEELIVLADVTADGQAR